MIDMTEQEKRHYIATWEYGTCGDPTCQELHLKLFNFKGRNIANLQLSLDALHKLQMQYVQAMAEKNGTTPREEASNVNALLTAAIDMTDH